MGNKEEMQPKIKIAGDKAILVEFEERIDPKVNAQVRSLAMAIESANLPGVQEILPAYRTLMIIYDPLALEYNILKEIIENCLKEVPNLQLPAGKFFRLPTVYGGEFGPDLERVAQITGLSAQEVIRIFSETQFYVYFIGFICGLAYLGGLPESLHVPRLSTPRTLVPGGSVGLAGGQANAIATDQPSGFNYIGRTFVHLYDPHIFPPVPFTAGDKIQFISVSAKEALQARGKWAREFIW